MEKFTEQDIRRYQRENKSFVAYGSEGTVFKYEDYAVKIFSFIFNAISKDSTYFSI